MADYNSPFTGAAIDAAITKVAGIEAGADVTDTANVTAAGALMDSEVTNLAAVKAFDPTDYATAAQGALADSAVQPGDDANTLGSGAATDGYVLTADGAGGAAWEAASGGGGSTDYVRTRAGVIQDLFDMADTWNDGATTFTSIKMNVTDTASSASSLLMDLQVGGNSKFKVDKAGVVTVTRQINSTGGFGNSLVDLANQAVSIYTLSSGRAFLFNSFGLNLPSTAPSLNFGTTTFGGSPDLFVTRDAANTLAQRNSTNAQTFNLYNTYTDASNYERGFMKWNANTLEIGTEAAGTGSARDIVVKPSGTNLRLFDGQTTKILGFYYSSTRNLFVYPQSSFTEIGGDRPIRLTSASAPLEVSGPYIAFLERATPPAGAANQARIFAEDDGTGKTRLMVQFGTGAAVQIAIEP